VRVPIENESYDVNLTRYLHVRLETKVGFGFWKGHSQVGRGSGRSQVKRGSIYPKG